MLIYATFLSDRAVLCIRHSKTIQYNEHTLDIPIPHITDSVMCPAKALLFVYKVTPSGDNQSISVAAATKLSKGTDIPGQRTAAHIQWRNLDQASPCQFATPWRHAGRLTQCPPAISSIQQLTHMDSMLGSQKPPVWSA